MSGRATPSGVWVCGVTVPEVEGEVDWLEVFTYVPKARE
jgi:hypothetical protein